MTKIEHKKLHRGRASRCGRLHAPNTLDALFPGSTGLPDPGQHG